MNNYKSQVSYSETVSDCDRLECALLVLGIFPDSPIELRLCAVKEIEQIATVLGDVSLESQCHSYVIEKL
jgi:hypothetical protein